MQRQEPALEETRNSKVIPSLLHFALFSCNIKKLQQQFFLS
jgi:hypothetical protein